MPFNPFNDADGSSLEQGNPIVNIPKKAVGAVTAQATQQAQAAKQTFVDQLYGNVTPTPDDGIESGNTQANPLQKMQAAAGVNQTGTAHTPTEQKQIDEARKKLQELQGQHNKSYYDATFGEEAQKKRQQEEEQERQLKAQEEEDEQQRKAQEKAQMDEEAQAFQSKGGGRNRMSAPPLAVTQAKTKTEINRGSTG